MSTRGVGIACLILAVILAFLAVVNLLGGPSPAGFAQLLSRTAILVAPLLALITGMYLLGKRRAYY